MALETLNRAVALAPNNPMCLFHHASMLVANDRLDDALQELESLKVITPKESLVYFLIGKVGVCISTTATGKPTNIILKFMVTISLHPRFIKS